MTDHKKPGAAFWATVVLVVALAYPLSFGAACRYVSRCPHPFLYGHEEIPEFYLPIGTLIETGPPIVADAIRRYAVMWSGDDGIVTVVPCLGASFKRGWATSYP